MNLRIFAITNLLPKPDRTAGDRRFFALLEMLAKHYVVDLCVDLDETNYGASPLTKEEQQRYCEMLRSINVRLLPFGWKHIAGAYAKTRYDIGLFEYFHVAEKHLPLFRRCQPDAKVIVDSVDLHYARESAGAALGLIAEAQAKKTRERELSVYRAADAVLVASPADGQLLESEGGMPPRFCFPIVLPMRQRPQIERGPEVLFVGSFSHSPNLDALRWFLSEIWNHIYEEVNEARFTIVGSNAPDEVQEWRQIPGVQVVGYVPEVEPYLDRAVVSIAPLRYGAGMNGKIVEAMVSGVPVVSTSVGAKGIGAISGQHLVVADGPIEFAQSVIDLLQQPEMALRIGQAGQHFIESLCGPEACERVVERMINSLVPTKPARAYPWAWLRQAVIFHTLYGLRTPFAFAWRVIRKSKL